MLNLKILELIRQIPIFATLTERDQRRLAEFDHTFVRYEKDEYIVREGSKGRSLHIIINGVVRVTRDDAPARPIATLRAGSLFGEISFLTGSLRTTNVVANEEGVVIMKIDRNTMNQLSPDVREVIKDRLIELLAARINKMNEVLVKIVQ